MFSAVKEQISNLNVNGGRGRGTYPALQVGSPCSWLFAGTARLSIPPLLWGHLLCMDMMPSMARAAVWWPGGTRVAELELIPG